MDQSCQGAGEDKAPIVRRTAPAVAAAAGAVVLACAGVACGNSASPSGRSSQPASVAASPGASPIGRPSQPASVAKASLHLQSWGVPARLLALGTPVTVDTAVQLRASGATLSRRYADRWRHHLLVTDSRASQLQAQVLVARRSRQHPSAPCIRLRALQVEWAI